MTLLYLPSDHHQKIAECYSRRENVLEVQTLQKLLQTITNSTGSITKLRDKSEGDRTGQHCNKGRCKIARSSTDSANIATVCDALTASPKRPCGKAPVRPGSLRPAITTYRDTIFGSCSSESGTARVATPNAFLI